MWAGFARQGLADAAVHGEFNCAPNAYVLYEMAKTIDAGKGVLFLCNHFMGDYLNNDMALELLAHEGIRARACYISDDVCSCIGEEKESRGGLHGIAQVAKLASAAAGRGDSLEQVWRLAKKGNERLRSVTMKVEEEGKLLVGPGFSGEPPVESVPFESADQLVSLAVDRLTARRRCSCASTDCGGCALPRALWCSARRFGVCRKKGLPCAAAQWARILMCLIPTAA